MKTLLITGGAGFIGSHFTHWMLNRHKDMHVIVLDLLTYAGRKENLSDLEQSARFEFIHGDIRDKTVVDSIMPRVDAVAHFAAETHNDRAILDAGEFIHTDVFGTFVLLESARQCNIERFLHISTDEVYGAIQEGLFTENSPIQPNMPYAASKAGGELMARAYHKTHKVPVIIARPSNNFGPNQYPEKLIPLFITNAIDNLPLPIYGNGNQVRDWIYVEDTCSALDLLLSEGKIGEAYNISANGERTNLIVTNQILSILGKPDTLIKHVADRPGHDVRYALSADKLRALGWEPKYTFEAGLQATVEWYIEHETWWRQIKESQEEYKFFMQKWYK